MPRTKGTINTKKVLSVKIYHTEPEEIVIFQDDFATLQEVASALGISYNQAYELSTAGRSKKKKPQFRYYPTIEIKRKEPTNADKKKAREKELYEKLKAKFEPTENTIENPQVII